MASVKLTHKVVLYSTLSAIEIELSKNGIFVGIAKSQGKNENGNITFDWKQKRTAKLSSSELAWFLEGLQTFRLQGKAKYEAKAETLTKGKYKNIQFPHVNKKNIKSTVGLSTYNESIQFIINYPSSSGTPKSQTAPDVSKNDDRMFFGFSMIDMPKVERFMAFILEQSFYYDSIDNAQYSLKGSGGDNPYDEFVSEDF